MSRRTASIANLVSGSGAYVILAIQGITTIPMLLAQVPAELFGLWLAISEILLWLTFFDFGISNYMTQRVAYYMGQENRYHAIEEFWSDGVLVVILCLIFGTAFYLAIPTLLRFTSHNSDFTDHIGLIAALKLSLVAVILIFVENYVIAFFRAIQKTIIVGVVSIVAAAFGFGSALLALKLGYGIKSIAFSFLVRAVVQGIGIILYFVITIKREFGGNLMTISKRRLIAAIRVVPISGAGLFSYAAMNQSSAFIVALFFGPHLAAIFGLTKKLGDAFKGVLDVVSMSIYSSFPHYHAEMGDLKTSALFLDISSAYYILAGVSYAAFALVNYNFLDLLGQKELFGGVSVSIMIAGVLFWAGSSYFINSIYRSLGEIKIGSALLLIEGICRTSLLLVAAKLFGLIGMLMMMMIVSFTFLIVGIYLINKKLNTHNTWRTLLPMNDWLIICVMFFIATIGEYKLLSLNNQKSSMLLVGFFLAMISTVACLAPSFRRNLLRAVRISP